MRAALRPASCAMPRCSTDAVHSSPRDHTIGWLQALLVRCVSGVEVCVEWMGREPRAERRAASTRAFQMVLPLVSGFVARNSPRFQRASTRGLGRERIAGLAFLAIVAQLHHCRLLLLSSTTYPTSHTTSTFPFPPHPCVAQSSPIDCKAALAPPAPLRFSADAPLHSTPRLQCARRTRSAALHTTACGSTARQRRLPSTPTPVLRLALTFFLSVVWCVQPSSLLPFCPPLLLPSSSAMPFNPDKLAKLVGKTGGPATVRTGGKGTVRRKHKAVRKTATHDDKRLKATLNKLAVRDIPAIEEVNLFKDDGHVIHFVNPKGNPPTSHRPCSIPPPLRPALTSAAALCGCSPLQCRPPLPPTRTW